MRAGSTKRFRTGLDADRQSVGRKSVPEHRPGDAAVYITVRKYRMTRPFAEVREAVLRGLVPLLNGSRGFQRYWILQCSDGDCAGISIFDTEENATAANDHTRAWVEAHIREIV